MSYHEELVVKMLLDRVEQLAADKAVLLERKAITSALDIAIERAGEVEGVQEIADAIAAGEIVL